MEGSQSEAVFESLNLKPQLFINEVLNSVDDLVDEAFAFFHRYISHFFHPTTASNDFISCSIWCFLLIFFSNFAAMLNE